MIQEVKVYWCDHPKDEDITEAMQIAKDNNCIVRLEWFVKYSGHYAARITPESTMEDVKKQIPKVYGI